MIESFLHSLCKAFDNPWFMLFGTVTLVQITPIKINPWSALLSWIRKSIVGELERNVMDLKNEFEKENINIIRWNVLDFANSCRNKRRHTKEEWNHCLDQLRRYESLCARRGIENGVIEEDSKYLRELYQKLCKENDFL